MKAPAHTLRDTIRVILVFGLPLTAFWILVLHVIPLFGHIVGAGWLSVMPHATMTVIYVATTAIVQLRPRLFSSDGWPLLCMLLVPAATLALFAGIVSEMLPLLVFGAVVYAIGECWLGIYATASLFTTSKGTCLLGLALTYPVLRCVTAGISLLDTSWALGIAFVIPFVTVALCRRQAREVLAAYRIDSSLEELKVTNPSSFLPFTSKLFLCVFLFTLAAGTLMFDSVSYGLTAPTIVVWACALGVTAFYGLRHREPSPNQLFLIASLFATFALMVVLGFPHAGLQLSHEAAQCGLSGCDVLLCWYTLYCLGSRNRLTILPAIAWGRAAMDLGLMIGSALQLGCQSLSSTGFSWSTLVYLAIAFGFVSYNLLAMRSFDFDELARGIKPLANMVQELQQTRGANSDEAVGEVLASQYHLTPREIEIFLLLARGRNVNYIENELVIARNTVKTHVRNIYGKVDVHSQQELIDLNNSLCSRE